jgi:arginyl-tRNA synthetase
MCDFWSVLESAALPSAPRPFLWCTYLFELCRCFNAWYEKIDSLMTESNLPLAQARLRMVQATAKVLKQGCNLIGIETLERM